MTPFQEFRLWLRRSPLSERLSAAVAAALALAVLVWVLVPTGSARNSEAFGPAASAGQAPASGAAANSAGQPNALVGSNGSGPAASTGTNGTGNAGPVAQRSRATQGGAAGERAAAVGPVSGGQAAGGTAGSKCVSPPGSAQGINRSQVKIAIAVVNVAGPAANSVFGIDDPKVYRAQYDAVIKSINAAGGVGCRKLVATYYDANPADSSQLHTTCLNIASDGNYAVIDLGSYAAVAQSIPCFPQNGVIYFGAYDLTEKMRRQYYPYLYAFDTFDNLYHNTVFALRDRGFFSTAKGFGKLGILYRSCSPELIQQELGWLHQVGLKDADIETYNFGCPQAFASPTDVQQAVLDFKSHGVTHVTYVDDLADFPNFTKDAQQQGFKPRYGLANDNLISTAYGNLAPDPNNIANALAITDSRDAEDRTPGMTPTAGTSKCMAILGPVTPSRTAQFPNPKYPTSGNPCDIMWMFQAAMNNATSLRPAGLADGLRAAGSIDMSFPQGPAKYSAAGGTTGGQFWRPLQFLLSCKCWQLADRQLRPAYS